MGQVRHSSRRLASLQVPKMDLLLPQNLWSLPDVNFKDAIRTSIYGIYHI